MEKKTYLLPQTGNIYKANLHSHTTVSDGHLTPFESKKLYKEHGYQIVAYTDHRIYKNHTELNDDEFLAVAAFEVDINETADFQDFSRIKTYHINLFDTDPDKNKEEKEKSPCPKLKYGDMEYINQYIREMKELGFIACYNHPYWSLQNYDDIKGLEGFFAMEIYNYGCEHDGLYGYNPQAYDEMLRLGKRMLCLSTDDNHNSYPPEHQLCDSFGGYVMLKAQSLDYQAVMKALQRGEFYSTMGPEINELYIETKKHADKTVHTLVVKTSPVQKIYVKMEGRNCYKEVAEEGRLLAEARFELTGEEGYIRVECRDEKGLYANSNAYFLDTLLI